MNKKYKIYLDVCCLNRPFDDQKQTRIRLESEAILIVLNKFKTNEWQLITSNAIEAEIIQITNREKLQEISQILSIATIMTQNEILTKGYQALREALGVVGMIRFIQYFNEGKGDYTKERHDWLDSKNVEDVLKEMNKLKNVENISAYYENEN